MHREVIHIIVKEYFQKCKKENLQNNYQTSGSIWLQNMEALTKKIKKWFSKEYMVGKSKKSPEEENKQRSDGTL